MRRQRPRRSPAAPFLGPSVPPSSPSERRGRPADGALTGTGGRSMFAARHQWHLEMRKWSGMEKATTTHGSLQTEDSAESIALPDFLEPRRRLVYGRLLKIRAKRLLDRDLTGERGAQDDLPGDLLA